MDDVKIAYDPADVGGGGPGRKSYDPFDGNPDDHRGDLGGENVPVGEDKPVGRPYDPFDGDPDDHRGDLGGEPGPGHDVVTVVVTERVTDVVTVVVTEVVTERVTDIVTVPVTEVVTERVTDIVTVPVTETVTERVTDVVTVPVTEVVTERVTDVVTVPVTEVVTERVTDVVTERVTDVVTVPVTEVVTERVTDIVTVPVTETVTERVTDVVTVPVTETVTDVPSTDPPPSDPTPVPPTDPGPIPDRPTPVPPTPVPPTPGPDKPIIEGDQKYHLDEKTLKQITVTDEDGKERQVWVAQTVADRDLRTRGTDNKEVVVANKGDHGGYVEVLCDENGQPIKNADGTLPLPVPAGEDGVDNGKGGLKGLSQNDMSWTQPGTYLVGNAGITMDAQFVGPDAIISGADQITGDVGIGGSGFRSSGESTFEGKGSYIDMQMDAGAKYTFTGGTQIGGPAHFKQGEGVFCDDEKTGRITMMFAARDGSELEVSTMKGFQSNGLAALDDTVIAGGFQGNPDMVIQDSTVATFAKFTGPVTVVNQHVGMEANDMVIKGDADLDEVALTRDPKDPVTEAYNTYGQFESQADYLAHVSDVLTHELGEQYADTGVQHHYDDVHAEMNNDLESKWREIQEVDPSMSRADFDKLYRNLSGYHDGINDGITEDIVEVRKAGGDRAVEGLLEGVDEDLRAQILEGGDEAVQAYLDKNGIEANVAETRAAGAQAALDEFNATSEAKSWGQGSERRGEAQSDGMYWQTSSGTQWQLTADPDKHGGKNEQAAQGLHGADWKTFGQSPSATGIEADAPTALTDTGTTEKPNDWRLAAANKLNPKSQTQSEKQDDGPEMGG